MVEDVNMDLLSNENYEGDGDAFSGVIAQLSPALYPMLGSTWPMLQDDKGERGFIWQKKSASWFGDPQTATHHCPGMYEDVAALLRSTCSAQSSCQGLLWPGNHWQ